MSVRLKIWLLAIIGLCVLAFFFTFRPVTRHQRKNPANPHLTIPAAATIAGKFYLYPPVPTLRLDLDLQGGMRVALRLRRTAHFEYLFAKPFAKNERERGKIKRALLDALPDTKEGLGQGRTIEISDKRDRIVITTRAEKAPIMKRQHAKIQQVLRDKIGPSFEAKKPRLKKITDQVLDQVVGIVERRVNSSGLTEARVRKQPKNEMVMVEIPGVKDPKDALALIQKTAVLEFKHIPPDMTVNYTDEGDIDFFRAGDQLTTKQVLDEAETRMTGSELEAKCRASPGPGGGTDVLFTWKREAADKFYQFTLKHLKQHLAIVLDGELISAPRINDPIRRHGRITGNFTIKEATELANLLNAGALPVPMTVEENRVVSATLGQDSINSSLWAALVGLLAVLIFMAAYYRLPGLLADLALIIYGLLILFALRLFNATLTLPGIAGIIISLGMAVDANVIIFERLKEELRTGKTMKSAIEAGFNRAWTAILDSNVCSLLTGFVLWGLGTPAIKGFAIALIIGVGVSMFTAITVTRLFVDISANTRFAQKPAWFGV